MEVSLTELRQRLFELADRVLDTGEAIVINRRGRTLRIVRDEAAPKAYSRLAKLRPQPYEIGPDLDPHESPAMWSELTQGVAETAARYRADPAPRVGAKASRTVASKSGSKSITTGKPKSATKKRIR